MLYDDIQVRVIASRVAKIAAESPNYVYVQPSGTLGGDNMGLSCSYSEGRVYNKETSEFIGFGGCLIGQAIASLGFPVPGGEYGDTGIQSLIRGGEWCNDAELGDNPAANWLDKVQYWQDRGTTWGEAVKNATLSNGYNPIPA